MGDVKDNWNTHTVLGIVFAFCCAMLHVIYRIITKNNEKEEPSAAEKVSDSTPVDSSTDVPETRPTTKSKKRAPWKGNSKTEVNHPWLYKNLKGHPGTVLHADLSANGKYLAATCNEIVGLPAVELAAVTRRKQRERRRSTPPPPPPALPPGCSVAELAALLQPHIVPKKRLWAMGFPMKYSNDTPQAIVYMNPPPRARQTTFDVNAKVFVPGTTYCGDSGVGSYQNSPKSDSDEELDETVKMCVRCDSTFKICRNGAYMSSDTCGYHWGKMIRGKYQCCNGHFGARACTSGQYHVWNGYVTGMNGPFDGFVRARTPRGGVYAIDAEMVYTTAGLELASIAVVNISGQLVYRTLVRPSSPVLDHNTRFSGIRPRDLLRATKTLKDVQNDILGFVGSDTILIGHALENDLRALKMIHGCVVDTSIMYPHERGLPMRRSLKVLCEELLHRDVQRGYHSPLEDSRAALDLVLLKVNSEKAARSQQLALPSPPHLQPYDPLVIA